ncbi:MAG: CcmD family protein [Clostridia bacterium]|nr:CcmD family protein [Clostridia bacterium]
MEYLFAAYAVIWTVIFGYTLMLGKRQKELEQEVFLLRKSLEGKQ